MQGMTDEDNHPAPSRTDLAIGIVQSRFNRELTDAMAQACITELMRLGVGESDIDHLTVPGALELPVALQALAASRDYDALIAVGCVIRGETYHFELVANESARGIGRVALDHALPVANAVLTCETLAQAQVRSEPKAREAARVAVEMANLLDELS